MGDELWIAESLYPGWGQRFLVRRELARLTSAFQDILVFDTVSHGVVLMLDGAVQITEADEFVYQEMIAHVPLIAHGAARDVLIIGAGDGGVLRRVLEHRGVRRATMVEIDGEVIRVAKEFLPRIGGDAWHDARADVIVGDGVDHLRRAPDNSVDVMIIDSTDPVGVGAVLFTDEFYSHAARVLREDGLVVNQCGVPLMQGEELRASSARRRKFFPHVSAYVVAVPTYVGGFMTLGIAGKSNIAKDAGLAAQRAKQSAIEGRTRYWSPDVHAAAFALPPYIAELLPS